MAGGEDPESDSAKHDDEGEEITFGPMEGTGSQVGRKSLTGQTCSLRTLIEDDVLQPGSALLEMTLMVRLPLSLSRYP